MKYLLAILLCLSWWSSGAVEDEDEPEVPPAPDPLTPEQVAEADRTAEEILAEWRELERRNELPPEERKLYTRFLLDTRLLLTRTRQSLEDRRPMMAVRYFMLARRLFAKIPDADGPKLGPDYRSTDRELLAMARTLLDEGVLGEDDARPPEEDEAAEGAEAEEALEDEPEDAPEGGADR